MGSFLINGIRKVFGVERTMILNKSGLAWEPMEFENRYVSSHAILVNEEKTPKLPEGPQVQAHEEGMNLILSKDAFDLIKHNKSASHWREIGDDILPQKSPMENTVLHIAALYGNDNCVEMVVGKAYKLLAAKNANGDTALHVAARTGHISTLEKLLAASLHNLPHPYSEKPKEALDEILVKNKQGNTFFHEALLNGHKGVTKILGSQELQIEAGFKELVERAALFWTNNEEKSVLHLAIEKGFEEIVDHALTKLTRKHSALDKLIENHQELAEMIPAGRGMKNQQQDSSSINEITEVISEKPSSGTGKHQELSQDSTKENLNENHQKLAQLIPYGSHYVPLGELPLIVAILKQNRDILKKILKEKKEWIRFKNEEGRTALHYAASIGYLNGVEDLLGSYISCNMERDKDGFFPLHLASAGGHVEVIKKLLEHCPDPREILDNDGRNIVHIATQMGKFNVVRYILQDAIHGLVNMINDKDANGNTPLHLATLHCHPKIVHALTWDKRVDLSLVNGENQTALDAYMQFPQENPPLRQLLTGIAIVSAGIQEAKKRSQSIKVPPSPKCVCKLKVTSMDPYKDRINTLMLVSTLITTVAFAAGFTLPGGTNNSDPGQGMALMLNHVWFNLFIFCITISMYGGIGVTIILIWAQLGDITLALYAFKRASLLLGVTLATLSVAFLAGVHLVISDLSWLATTFLVLCVISILMLLTLYTTLWIPSSSSNPLIRYISYCPFRFLTRLIEQDEY